MDVYEAVTTRRSIREFKDIPVPYDTLEKCVNAARLAPSARNRQICEHIIVDDEQLLPQVFDTVRLWLGTPPLGRRPKAYIITLINNPLGTALSGTRIATLCDVGMAAENMILVAFEQGVGTCAVLSFRESELKQVLNIPEKYEVAFMLALGFPDESPVLEVATDSTKPWIDSNGARHIPKRELKNIIHRNRFQ